MNATTAPIEKSVVLVGAGNAHLIFLKKWGMNPIPGVAVTLVSESAIIPYSAMVPGYLAGDYSWNDVSFDLVRFCQSVKVRFLAEKVERIDPAGKRVEFKDRPPLTYDALGLGLGSLPLRPSNGATGPTAFLMRPMARFIRDLDALDARLRQTPAPYHLVVVGGGASGCELTLALARRFAKHPGFRVTLLQGDPRLVPEFPEKVAKLFQAAFNDRSITVRLDARATGGDGDSLRLENGERIPCDGVVWATSAAAPPILRDSGLTLNEAGFLVVGESLQSPVDPSVFGTGDCVHFPAYPTLLKNGVHAVRQGAVLFDNIAAHLRETPLRPFRPQRHCLCLLNTGDGDAIFRYGSWAWKGRAVRKWKDRIDRRWVEKFTTFAPMTPPTDKGEAHQMRCGGCGSKISADVLSAVLKRIEIVEDPRVLLGCRAGEDAAVFKFQPALYGSDPAKLVEVQTVDYFKAFVDDPYLFGRIAALNSVSDLYAMNARPFSALAIATLPHARGPIQEAQLYELLAGATRSLREAGVVLAGGHTTEGEELALGFAVTGYAEEDRLFRKSGLRVGDRLILTKPLGSGALLAAWMRGACKADWYEKLVREMLISNRAAGELFRDLGVTACTDITGFGFAGHLLEMLDGSNVSASIDAKSIPLYEGFAEVTGGGIVSSLHRDNAKVASRVAATSRVPDWLFDPQTSGGLLGAVRPEMEEKTLGRLREVGCVVAAVIGEVVAAGAEMGPMILLP